MYDCAGLRLYDIQPPFAGPSNDVITQRRKDSDAGGLLGILCRLLLIDVFSLHTESSRGGRKLPLDGHCTGYIDQHRLVFKQRGYEEQAMSISALVLVSL